MSQILLFPIVISDMLDKDHGHSHNSRIKLCSIFTVTTSSSTNPIYYYPIQSLGKYKILLQLFSYKKILRKQSMMMMYNNNYCPSDLFSKQTLRVWQVLEKIATLPLNDLHRFNTKELSPLAKEDKDTIISIVTELQSALQHDYFKLNPLRFALIQFGTAYLCDKDMNHESVRDTFTSLLNRMYSLNMINSSFAVLCLNNRAARLWDLGQIQSAIEDYSSALTIDSKYCLAWYCLSFIFISSY
jgi:tetratricopeptide (TPR) repeat protein